MNSDDIERWLAGLADADRLREPDIQASNDRSGEPSSVSGGYFGQMMNEWAGQLKWSFAKSLKTIEEPFPDTALPYLIQVPCVVVIVGSRGTGKTTLGCSLLEGFRDHRWDKFVVGIPRTAQRHFPAWIKQVPTLWDLPNRAIALVDEAHLKHGMRMSEQDRRDLIQMLSQSRQREQLLIFVSQQTRTLSREIVAAADVLIIKRMLPHQVKFERPEFEEALSVAQEKLKLATTDRRKLSYVYAPDDEIEMLMTNEMPSFWSESVSNMFAGTGLPPRSLREEAAVLRQDAIALAKRLHADGWSYGMIARRLGVSKGTAWNYVNRAS